MGVVIDCRNCKITEMCKYSDELTHLKSSIDGLLGDVSYDHIPVVKGIEADISISCTYYQDNDSIREPQYRVEEGCK